MIFCMFANGIVVNAETFDPTHKGSISLILRTSVGDIPIEGAEFRVYKAGECHFYGGRLTYTLTPEFEPSGIDLREVDKKETAKAAADYLRGKTIPFVSGTTDANGELTIDNLDVALYLVVQSNTVKGFSKVAPFFIAVGIIDGENVSYDSDASPKVEVGTISDPPGGTPPKTTPPAVTGTPPVTPAVNVSVTPIPSVVTTEVPKLVQTGQHKWQILVLCCVGLGLILSGLMIKTKKDE